MEQEVQTEFISANSLLYATSHRPWAPPDGPWVMTQTWNDLAFLHYAVEPAALRALVPDVLTLDLFSGSAFVSITPLVITNVRPPGIPAMPVISHFCELNVRTYVTYEDKPGIYFFSLDAANLSAVWGARVFYRLPYWHADMKAEAITGKLSRGGLRRSATPAMVEIAYRNRRIHGPKAKDGMPEFRGRYRPIGDTFEARPRSIDSFLAERYCLYSWNRGRLYRGEIHHLPWPLQNAECEIERNTMAEPAGIQLPSQPDIVQFSRTLKVLIWPPERLR